MDLLTRKKVSQQFGFPCHGSEGPVDNLTAQNVWCLLFDFDIANVRLVLQQYMQYTLKMIAFSPFITAIAIV